MWCLAALGAFTAYAAPDVAGQFRALAKKRNDRIGGDSGGLNRDGLRSAHGAQRKLMSVCVGFRFWPLTVIQLGAMRGRIGWIAGLLPITARTTTPPPKAAISSDHDEGEPPNGRASTLHWLKGL